MNFSHPRKIALLRHLPMILLKSAVFAVGLLSFSSLSLSSGAAGVTTPPKPAEACPQPLPLSKGQAFPDLDSYLAHRKKLGAMDLPYYWEVAPDVFQLMLGRGHGDDAPQLFTREQLLTQFCFKD